MIKLNPLLLIALTQDFLNAALEPESYLSEKTIGEFETEEGFFNFVYRFVVMKMNLKT
jgi:hypothetical protein